MIEIKENYFKKLNIHIQGCHQKSNKSSKFQKVATFCRCFINVIGVKLDPSKIGSIAHS